MSKPEVIMTDWELYVYDNQYQLTGTAINHPRIGRWAYVAYTTNMEDHSFEDDFRYFPGQYSMETYSWSDNIKYAVIKNCLEEAVTFNQTYLAPGETKVFTTEGHHQGLVSPDCYNGKSCLW